MASVLKSIIICVLLFAAFSIRTHNVVNIPEGLFIGADAYLYYWQAHLISENGHLPERDMHRWLPLGRDLGQTLNLYSYAVAYAHKAIVWFFPNVSLYQVMLYAPALCFCIGLAALCLLLSHTHSHLFSVCVGVLLATLPGSIERSTAGFSDRDAWCLMLGILSVTTYLVSLQAQRPRHRLFWTLASSFTVFLGGLSWEGFGVFISIILCVELWRFLSSENEEGLGYYILWVCCFVPILYLVSPAYRSGYGFAEHLFAWVLIPPVMLLGIRTLRSLLMLKVERCRQNARTFTLGGTLTCLALALAYVWTQLGTFASTTVPFSKNALMQVLGELQTPAYEYWIIRYGSVFLLGGIGTFIVSIRLWKRHGALLTLALALFTTTTFFRHPMNTLLGTTTASTLDPFLFGIAITGCATLFAWIASRRYASGHKVLVSVAFIVWLLIWGSLARDARRYDFFIGVPLAFFTAELIQCLFNAAVSQKLTKFTKITQNVPQHLIKTGVAALTLTLILFWNPIGGHATRALFAATQMQHVFPRKQSIRNAFEWMKDTLSDANVVAASWSYGTQLNVLGGVKTITDPDHYIQHWIHLYYRNVALAESERQALDFLKTHQATHLMFTDEEVIQGAEVASTLAGPSKLNLKYKITPFVVISGNRKLIGVPVEQTHFKNIRFDINPETKRLCGATVTLKNGETTDIPYVAFYNKARDASKNQSGAKTGGLLLYFDEQETYKKGYYVPANAWETLAIRLLLRDTDSPAFLPVYPTEDFETAPVKVWEIHYPPDIQNDPKYLRTGIPEIDDTFPFHATGSQRRTQ